MKLIKNNSYLLLIDEEAEIKRGDYLLEKESIINVFPDYLTDLDECDKIIAYYPLTKEAKELDLPLLPPFKEDNPFLNGTITKATCYTDNGTFYIEELKKLFETQPKQFSLEDMINAFNMGQSTYKESFLHKNVEERRKETKERFIKSLSTQQLPEEFLPLYQYKNERGVFIDTNKLENDDCKLKTITNSEGKQEIQGKYVY